jgi:hypothetical protein
MDKQLSERDRVIWQELNEAFRAFTQASMTFMAEGVNRVALLRAGFHSGNRACALRMATVLKKAELQQLLDELVWLSLDHGFALAARELIVSLPREWVLARIETIAEPYLRDGTYDEYRRILELYSLLDDNLTHRLARRAAAHTDPDIQEAGNDFLGHDSSDTL